MVTTRAMKAMTRRALGWIAAAVGIAAAAPAAASTITYYHNDIAGSPVAATNAAGQVIWRESYRPYGERLTKSASAKSNDVWFTSRREDSSGLVYMGARHYDPVAARFVSTDPKGFDEANVMSFGRYTYANDNPYKYVDPDGKAGVLATTAAGAEIGTFVCATPCTVVGGIVGFGLGVWGTWKLANVLHNESTDGGEKAETAKPQEGKTDNDPKANSSSGKQKDVPNRADPGAVIEGQRRTREYNDEGRPLRDYDKPHQGAEYPHVHEWEKGVREHPGRPYSPLPKNSDE